MTEIPYISRELLNTFHSLNKDFHSSITIEEGSLTRISLHGCLEKVVPNTTPYQEHV